MNEFLPSVALRQGNSSQFLATPVEKPAGMLSRLRSVILLIHGFNNTSENASEAYTEFEHLLDQDDIPLVGVHWPGSNWSNFLFYMSSVGRAKEAAPRLAHALQQAASGQPVLRVNIVAHSMGCRLALELLRLLSPSRGSNVVVDRVVLMAAAVPIFAIDPGGHLRDPLMGRVRVLNHYSDRDSVLKYAFRIGQSLAAGPEGAFPVALGSQYWTDPYGQTSGTLTQRDAHPAGHSDYWGWRRQTVDLARETTGITRTFLFPTRSAPRWLPSRGLMERVPTADREPAPTRTVRARH